MSSGEREKLQRIKQRSSTKSETNLDTESSHYCRSERPIFDSRHFGVIPRKSETKQPPAAEIPVGLTQKSPPTPHRTSSNQYPALTSTQSITTVPQTPNTATPITEQRIADVGATPKANITSSCLTPLTPLHKTNTSKDKLHSSPILHPTDLLTQSNDSKTSLLKKCKTAEPINHPSRTPVTKIITAPTTAAIQPPNVMELSPGRPGTTVIPRKSETKKPASAIPVGSTPNPRRTPPQQSLPPSQTVTVIKPPNTSADEKHRKKIRSDDTSPSETTATSKTAFSFDFLNAQRLPLLSETCPNEIEKLFIEKIKLCCFIFDFRTDIFSDYDEKHIKIMTFYELTDFISNACNILTDAVYSIVFKMITLNTFRVLPPPTKSAGPEWIPAPGSFVDDPTPEASWPHLQQAYNFFVAFLQSPTLNPRVAGIYINQKFVLNLLVLFNSEDSDERECVTKVVYEIYKIYKRLRAFIRQQFSNILCTYIYEIEPSNERHNGITELLKVMDSIINGFELPLKDEHKKFFFQILIPLHKPHYHSIKVYHDQLVNCVEEFLKKDSSLTKPAVQRLLRFWPKTDTQKEVLFLNEFKILLIQMKSAVFEDIMIPVFKQIGRCISSPHCTSDNCNDCPNRMQQCKNPAASATTPKPVIHDDPTVGPFNNNTFATTTHKPSGGQTTGNNFYGLIVSFVFVCVSFLF